MRTSNFLAIVIFALLATQIATFATTVYLHRGLSHRALTVKPAAALPFRFFIWITTGMKPREWVAVHRKHHAATDTPDDPHSPKVLGFWRVQLGNVGLYKKVASDELQVHKYARDIKPDRLDALFFDHALFGLGLGIGILVTITWGLGFGIAVGVLAALLHTVMYLMMAGAINAVTHTFGKQPYDNSATNLQTLAIVTGGEALHNNHHAAPTSAKFALAKGQFDPGWYLVKLLVFFKLASVRHEEVHLKSAA